MSMDGTATPVSTTPRMPVERTFVTHDGTELFYRVWPASGGVARGSWR